MDNVLEWLPDGFYAVDRTWRITYLNSQFERMLRVKKEACLGRNLWESFPYLLQTECYELFQHAIRENVTVTFKRHDDVANRWLEATAHPSPSGLLIFLRDVTEQRLNEKALLQANERFRLAAKADAIYDWNIESNHLFWGDALRDLFGYRSDELQIAQWEAALHPDEKEGLLKGLANTLGDPAAGVWKQEYRLRKKNGEFCFAYERGYIVRNAEGRAVRMVGVLKNITGRKRLEQELQEQQRQMTAAAIAAQEKERSLISKELHDNVNQLLTSAKLYAGLGRNGAGDTSLMMDKTIGLVQQAIDEIRALSKRLSDPFITVKTLEDSVRELIELVSETHQISISLVTETPATVKASVDVKLAVYRILQEHLTNILKHAAATKVEVVLRNTEGAVTLAVSDDGKGFDKNKRSFGVGLSNMRSRTESLQGIFTIDSSPGKGCRLSVTFPNTLDSPLETGEHQAPGPFS